MTAAVSKPKSSDMHVVVVGAGIGGLSCALSLISKGIQVTLIEQHDYPGGKMRQATVAGQTIDCGPTVFTMRWIFDDLYRQADLCFDDHVNIVRSDLLARHQWLDKTSLDLYSDISRSVSEIEQFSSPHNARAFEEFAHQCKTVFKTLDNSFMRVQKPTPFGLAFSGGLKHLLDMSRTNAFSSLWNSLHKRFDDPRLTQLFARYATYCGSSPFQAPATLMLIFHAERSGVWAIEGGMQSLANSLFTQIEKRGCRCLFGTAVKQIKTNTHGVCGVELANQTSLSCDAVVFNGDTAALSNGLLGEELKKATDNKTTPSLSAFTKSEVAISNGFDLAHHTVFFGDDYHAEFNSIFKEQTICATPTLYVCAQDRTAFHSDATSTNQTKKAERLFTLMNAPARTFSDEECNAAFTLMKSTLNKHGVSFAEHQGRAVKTSPNDFAKLFPATNGALYGRPTHGWYGSFSRPGSRSRIKGLYLAGGSVHPGAGVPMVSLSGQLAAEKLMADHCA